jgi:hypothetical protein
MAWVRTDDSAPEHPKFIGLDDAEVALWWRALSYCNRNMTDGRVPAGALRTLSRARRPALVAEGLVAVGLWERTDDGSYQFHDYLDYQPSAAEIRDQRDGLSRKRSEAGRKGAAKRWQDDSKGHGKPMATGSQADGPDPDPDPEGREIQRAREAPVASEEPARPLADLCPSAVGAGELDALARQLKAEGDEFGADVCERLDAGRMPTGPQMAALRRIRDRRKAQQARAAASDTPPESGPAETFTRVLSPREPPPPATFTPPAGNRDALRRFRARQASPRCGDPAPWAQPSVDPLTTDEAAS